MVWQTFNKLEYENLDLTMGESEVPTEDILSPQEMILGVREQPVEVLHRAKSVKASIKGSAIKNKDKDKDKEKEKDRAARESTRATLTQPSLSTESVIDDPTCIGSGTLDLLPFFQGITGNVGARANKQLGFHVGRGNGNRASCANLPEEVVHR